MRTQEPGRAQRKVQNVEGTSELPFVYLDVVQSLRGISTRDLDISTPFGAVVKVELVANTKRRDDERKDREMCKARDTASPRQVNPKNTLAQPGVAVPTTGDIHRTVFHEVVQESDCRITFSCCNLLRAVHKRRISRRTSEPDRIREHHVKREEDLTTLRVKW